MPQSKKNAQQPIARPHSARATTLLLLAGGVASMGSSPAFGLAEAIRTLCPSGLTGVRCPWYEGGGPVFTQYLDNTIFTGSRTIIGLVSGLFPLSSHEALTDDLGDSRVLVELVASSLNGGDGDPSLPSHVELRTNSTGILHAAMGNGLPRDPDPLARGVAFTAGAYAAAVAVNVSPTGDYAANLPGLASSLLAMAHEPTATSLGIDQTADVIVTDLQLVGDYESEGYLSRAHDAIAYMTDVMMVAGTGDGAAAAFPPDQQDLEFRTIGMPAGAFNTMGVAAFTTPLMTDDTSYIEAADFSGRGRVDARDWRSFNPQQPSGFDVNLDVRYGVDVGAPGFKLRLATAEGEGAYSRDIEFPTPDDDLPGGEEIEGSKGTRFAAGLAAGSVALLQDGYKALLETEDPAFAHWIRPRLPFYAVRALLINSAARTTQWTNAGNQGTGAGNDIEESTQQPLDTVEGGGQISLIRLHEGFQGRSEFFGIPGQAATMDSPITNINTPLVRLPPSIGGDRADSDPDLGGGIGGIDPPLGGGGGGGGGGSQGPFIPDPFLRPRPINPMIPQPPNTLYVNAAVPVRSLGWDLGNVGNGWIDYAIIDPLNAEGTLIATLVWPRNHKINIPNVAAGQTLQIPADETSLELEDLNLRVYLGDGSGGARLLVAESFSEWNVVEHVVLTNPPLQGEYIMRVMWEIRRYDVFNNNFVADQKFALAWRFDVQGADDAPPLLTGPAGDLNHDGFVTMEDVNMVLQAFGSTNSAADVNGDGVVNFFDLNIVLSGVQNSSQNDGGDL